MITGASRYVGFPERDESIERPDGTGEGGTDGIGNA